MPTSPSILQLTTWATGGGIQTFVRSLADGVADRGWRSEVAFYRGEAPDGAHADYVSLPAGGLVRRWPFAFARLVRSRRPDIVHVHGTTPGSLGALASRVVRHDRVVYTEHAIHADLPAPWRALRRAAGRLPTRSVAVCSSTARSLVEDARVPAERVLTIPSGTPDAPPLGPPRGRDLVYVAHFWPWKGHTVLLDALARIDPALGATLTLVGDGPERPRIESSIERLGLGGRVRLTGELGDPWTEAAGAWAYVHPSLRDARPLALLEALMRGLPAVATTTGSVPEVVADGRNGMLVAPGDAAALARRLEDLLRAPSLRDEMSRSARDAALRDLRLDLEIDAYIDLYERLLRT